jgi:MFS family permease
MAVETAPAAPTDDEPRRSELSRRHINVVFGTVLLGMLLAAIDQTIVSTALPTIVGDLGGAGHLSWVVSSTTTNATSTTADRRSAGRRVAAPGRPDRR